MTKREGQDNLRDILILANQGYNKKIIEEQKQIIEFLRLRNGKVARHEIEKELVLNFSHLPEGKEKWKTRKKFYFRISPLLKICLNSDKEELRYYLSGTKFASWFDSLRRTGKETFGGFE
jgi:hypothetical protein